MVERDHRLGDKSACNDEMDLSQHTGVVLSKTEPFDGTEVCLPFFHACDEFRGRQGGCGQDFCCDPFTVDTQSECQPVVRVAISEFTLEKQVDCEFSPNSSLHERCCSHAVAAAGMLSLVFGERRIVDFHGDVRVRQAIGAHFERRAARWRLSMFGGKEAV